MKLAITAALTLMLATPAFAQMNTEHSRAWDAYERGTSKEAKQVTRGKRQQKRSGRVLARLSPSISHSPLAAAVNAVAKILPHPSGCPARLFCGCGASVELFGRPVRHLFLAANWLKFPPAAPGPGMVAANRSHVMVIKQMVGPNRALVYDANSGRGLTRLHVRSLAGFSVRNPRA